MNEFSSYMCTSLLNSTSYFKIADLFGDDCVRPGSDVT